MKIGVAGTGAVGGYFGGLLSKAGNDVVFLARGKNHEVMNENGLLVETEAGKFRVHESFTDQYDSFADVDLVLFCVKSTATKEAAQNLLPFLKPGTAVLTLQNGVDNEEILSEVFGEDRVLSAAAYIQAHIKEPGVVKQIGIAPRLILGSLSEKMIEKAEQTASILNNANIQTYHSSSILQIKWKKLLWNVTFNPLSAIIESKVGDILDDVGLRVTAQTICKEAIAVARMAGIDIDEQYYQEILDQGELGRNHQTSMLQDKLNGKEMEIESICGFIINKGKELNVATPVIETIYHLLKYEESRNRSQLIEN